VSPVAEKKIVNEIEIKKFLDGGEAYDMTNKLLDNEGF
jgi:hypothetical protein